MRGLTSSAGNKQMVTYKCAKTRLTRNFLLCLCTKFWPTEKVRTHKYINYLLHVAKFLKAGMEFKYYSLKKLSREMQRLEKLHCQLKTKLHQIKKSRMVLYPKFQCENAGAHLWTAWVHLGTYIEFIISWFSYNFSTLKWEEQPVLSQQWGVQRALRLFPRSCRNINSAPFRPLSCPLGFGILCRTWSLQNPWFWINFWVWSCFSANFAFTSGLRELPWFLKHFHLLFGEYLSTSGTNKFPKFFF